MVAFIPLRRRVSLVVCDGLPPTPFLHIQQNVYKGSVEILGIDLLFGDQYEVNPRELVTINQELN